MLFYDALNRLTRRDGQTATEQALYTYDAAGQLLQACAKVTGGCLGEYGVVASASTPSYRYDAAGNRTDSAAAAIIGAGNQTRRFKGDTLTYDADGNVLTKVGHGKSWAYSWDAFDRLSEVTESGVLIMHSDYDAFDRRVSTWNNAYCSAQRHIWDGDQYAVATNCYAAATDEYGWYPGAEQPMSAKFGGRTGVVLTDHALGASVYGIADADSGANSLIKNYHGTSPWGESPADTGITFRLRMAGQQYDQTTGLYYMRARFYDPSMGRFLSEDPIGIDGGLNLYAYSGNDPINTSDPAGEDPDQLPCIAFNGEPGVTDRAHPHGCFPLTPFELSPIYISSNPARMDPFAPVPWALGIPGTGQFSNVDNAGRCENRTFAALICILPVLDGGRAYSENHNIVNAFAETFEHLSEEDIKDLTAGVAAARKRSLIGTAVRAFFQGVGVGVGGLLRTPILLCPGCYLYPMLHPELRGRKPEIASARTPALIVG